MVPYRLLAALAATSFCATGCGSSDGGTEPGDSTLTGEPDPMEPDTTVDPTEPGSEAFDPPPPAEGMTRIVAPTIHDLAPADDVMYCQYVMEPLDHDVDILSVGGYQSRGGHHIVAFASTASANVPIGTTRLCEGEDNLSLAFLGAVGGEAGAGNVLPEGVAFRLPAGSGIMLNTHFLNTTQETFDGEGVLDIEFVDVDRSRQVASFFVNINMGFELPPNEQTAVDADCVIGKDMQFFAFSNHLHDFGHHIYTEVTRADTGDVEMIRDDPTWSYEMQFAAEFAMYDVDAPLLLREGDTLRTHCAWDNDSDDTLTFPREMCVGSGFFLTETPESPICMNGAWMDSLGGPAPVLDGPPCADEGAAGNDVGVGKHCTDGGGECPASASTCLADYTDGTWGNFCTTMCTDDADCGAGASCSVSAEGQTTRVCIPTGCVDTAVPAQ